MNARSRPLIVAHRGASHAAPENTLAAFRLAFEQDADTIEGDFRQTADGQIVCCHDATTARCGDKALRISATSAAELKTVDVGGWKSPRYAGERMPTLDEVLAIVPPGRGAFLELKGRAAGIVPRVTAIVLRSTVPMQRLRLMSFDLATVRALRRHLPEAATSWLVEYRTERATGRITPTHDLICRTLRENAIEGLGTQARTDVVTPDFASRLAADGRSLHAWTIDTPELADAFVRLGVASVTTNRPALIRGHLAGV